MIKQKKIRWYQWQKYFCLFQLHLFSKLFFFLNSADQPTVSCNLEIDYGNTPYMGYALEDG